MLEDAESKNFYELSELARNFREIPIFTRNFSELSVFTRLELDFDSIRKDETLQVCAETVPEPRRIRASIDLCIIPAAEEVRVINLHLRSRGFLTGHVGELAYVTEGFMHNAADSIMEKYLNGHNYVGEITVEYKFRDKKIRLEVGDNGAGGKYCVKKDLFVSFVSSKNYIPPYALKREGIHMAYSKKFIEDSGGLIGFQDNGENKGAVFWYEVPLKIPEP